MSDVKPRRSRGDRGGRPLPEGVAEGAGGEFYYRRGALLVVGEELRVREGLRSFLETRNGVVNREIGDGIVEVLVEDAARVLTEVEAEFGPDVGVDLDYLYVGAQTIKGGPWDEVEPAAPPTDWLDNSLGDGVLVGIVDTGIAFDPKVHPRLDGRFTADQNADRDVPTESGTNFLDEQGGHGTFVAGLVSRAAPAAHLAIARALHADGTCTTEELLLALSAVRRIATERRPPDGVLDVLNLSLGTFTRGDRPPKMLGFVLRAMAARGTVIVAAAGNHGSPRPFWPAAMPEVVGVGAVDGWAPAPFTNYGPWVDACAPGVDVVSTFFDESRMPLAGADLPPETGSSTPLQVTFPGYARWSGTSFAAPKVAGAIAAMATAWGVRPGVAADRLVRDWRLYRVPDLGVVVNLS